MIAIKIIIICILCSVVACGCQRCGSEQEVETTHPKKSGNTQSNGTPPPKTITPITDEMITFAGLMGSSYLVHQALQALKDGTPRIDINELNDSIGGKMHLGYTSLHKAASTLPKRALTFPVLTKEQSLELTQKIIRALLDRGANVNVQELKLHNTPLHIAVQGNNLAAVEVLVEGGADVNAKNKDDKTPLDLAVDQNIRKFLTEHGAK